MPFLKLVRLLLLLAVAAVPFARGADAAAQNVIVITLDGFRWQELFTGADADLLLADKKPEYREKFWRETPDERRKILMPFFWNEIAVKGQVFGAPDVESETCVTNPMHFSYPGYNEILCGFPDPKIDTNDKKPNVNTTVLEWLNKKPAFAGKVAAFTTWDVFPFIINRDRSKVAIYSAWERFDAASTPEHLTRINTLADSLPRFWPNNCWDVITQEGALEYIRAKKPRVLYISLGETDEWGHANKYSLYLDAANKVDAYVKRLWTEIQSMPEYAGKTALIMSSDHGRGFAKQWTSHKHNIPGSDRIWIAAYGAGVKGEGLRKLPKTTQSQIASTLAALLGEDYKKEVPQAGDVLPGLPSK